MTLVHSYFWPEVKQKLFLLLHDNYEYMKYDYMNYFTSEGLSLTIIVLTSVRIFHHTAVCMSRHFTRSQTITYVIPKRKV